MSRPYKRVCDSCGKEFTCRSNGRIYCFVCSPPQHAGAGRKDGRPGGMGLDVDGNLATRDDMKAANPPEPEPKPGSPKVGVDDSGKIAEMAREVTRIGTHVLDDGRPIGGWGKCRHISPKSGKEICDFERWSDRVPFCREHIRFWEERRQERRMRKLIEEEVEQLSNLCVEDFSFRNQQAAVDFLGKVNYAVFKNWIPVSKARALKEIVLAQVKALDSMVLAKRIEALLTLKHAAGNGDEFDFDPKELQDDIERADGLGLGDLAGALRKPSGKRAGA